LETILVKVYCLLWSIKVYKLLPDAKLLFRRATVHIALLNYEEAIADLTQAQTLQPNDGAISNKLKTAKQLLDKKKTKEMQAYKKMFS
jgi:tetratricopeptide (TPR) repeat protein